MISRQRKYRYKQKVTYEQRKNETDTVAKVTERQRWNKRKNALNLERHSVYSENPTPTCERIKQAYSEILYPHDKG